MNALHPDLPARVVDFPIPEHDDRSRRVVVLTDPASPAAEAVRAIRTRVIAQHVQLGRRAIAICSVSPSVQASFVAANLAVSMAQVGVRTLLVDADIRFAPIAAMFGLSEADAGLSDLLIDDGLDPSDVIRQMPLPGLSIITAGSAAEQGAEYLASARYTAIANRFMREHDLTIFNTTPSNRSADGQRVATVAGFALIVAAKDKSYVRDIETLATSLKADGAQVTGSVLLSA